jgi:uncharacterized protein (DUF169 family)
VLFVSRPASGEEWIRHNWGRDVQALDLANISARLVESLGLERPPVALKFGTERPPGVALPPTAVRSSCSFWRQAEGRVFYASAEDHFNCPVGSMVMGFELPSEVSQQLDDLVKFMCGECYISAEEAAKIPRVQQQGPGVLYGQLAMFPAEPDVILMWLIPHQAMIFNEAVGDVNWASELMQVSGRPGCAAIPRALERHKSGLSLGCAGMRTFSGIGDDELLAIVPGDQVEAFVEALERTVNANEAVMSYYQQQE